MSTQVRLNLYERGILASLVENHGFKPDTARHLVVDYIKIIRKLGGYDNCDHHAERLVRASVAGYRPEEWLRDLMETERNQLHDRGIPEREIGPEYAQL